MYYKWHTLILFECGSVHTKPASISLTRFKPFNFFKHNVNSSRDSKAHGTHSAGGFKYRSQPRQKYNVTCFGMPSVISTWERRHPTHIFEGLGSITVPHSQHNLQHIKWFYKLDIQIIYPKQLHSFFLYDALLNIYVLHYCYFYLSKMHVYFTDTCQEY